MDEKYLGYFVNFYEEYLEYFKVKNVLSIPVVLRISEAGWQVAVLLSLPQLGPAPPPTNTSHYFSVERRGGVGCPLSQPRLLSLSVLAISQQQGCVG